MVFHLLSVGAAALVTPPDLVGNRASRHGTPRMGMFDGLAAAFANDGDLGEKQGFKSSQVLRTISWHGPDGVVTSQALPGQKLRDVARQVQGIGPIKYSCNEGTCSTCDMLCNGDRLPACVAVMPDWDVELEWGLTRKEMYGIDRQEQASTRVPKPNGRVVRASVAGAAEISADVDEGAPRKLTLEERLMAENAGKKKKGLFG